MASPTWWTWVWVNSGRWWWTGRPGLLLFMGSQRVGHNWVTELNWTELCYLLVILAISQIFSSLLYLLWLLLNQTWVCSPDTQQSQSADIGLCGEGKHSIYCKAPSNENGHLMFTRSKLFQKWVLKDSIWGGGCSLLIFFWLVGGEITQWSLGTLIINLLVQTSLRSMFLWLACSHHPLPGQFGEGVLVSAEQHEDMHQIVNVYPLKSN